MAGRFDALKSTALHKTNHSTHQILAGVASDLSLAHGSGFPTLGIARRLVTIAGPSNGTAFRFRGGRL